MDFKESLVRKGKTYTHMHNRDIDRDVKLSAPVANIDYLFIGHCNLALKSRGK